jgi:hypothetical protein
VPDGLVGGVRSYEYVEEAAAARTEGPNNKEPKVMTTSVGVMTRFAHPHVATCIHVALLSLCCHLPLPFTSAFTCLEELQMRTFKRYFSHAVLLTTLHQREMN